MTAPQPSEGLAPTDAGTGAPAATDTQPNPTATPEPTAPAPGAQPAAEPQDVSSLPQWAQKMISDTRSEAAKHRTEKQTAAQRAQEAQAQRDAVLKALGLTPDGKDEPPDPAVLSSQLEEQQNAAWANAVELAVFRSSGTGVNADALLDSRKFVDSLDGFVDQDPRSPEFRQALQEHIASYVEANPQFRAGTAEPPPPRAELGGRHPDGSALSPLEQLYEQIHGTNQ